MGLGRLLLVPTFVVGLGACEMMSHLWELSNTMGEMAFRLLTYPVRLVDSEEVLETFPVNTCIETDNERICRFHLKKEIDEGPIFLEHYLVYTVGKTISEEGMQYGPVELTLGIRETDSIGSDEEPYIDIRRFGGMQSEVPSSVPTFYIPGHPFNRFMVYFNNPTIVELDVSRNFIKLIDEPDKKVRRMFLENIDSDVRDSLELFDGQLFPKFKEKKE
jgi:hypothetical protein